MSASLLYHTNQIEDVQVKKVEYLIDQAIFSVTLKPRQPLCPCCGYNKNVLKGSKTRRLRMAPLGKK